MTPPARCRECGDVKPLNRAGVCRYRGGCEHRVYQHDARVGRLLDAMDRGEAFRARVARALGVRPDLVTGSGEAGEL